MSDKVLVTGATGNCGSELVRSLLNDGFKVIATKRRSSSNNTSRIDDIFHHPNLEVVYFDLSDPYSILNVIGDFKPQSVYHLAAQSHVGISFNLVESSFDITGTGVLRVLEAVRKASPKTRVLNSSSSEIFGNSPEPQNEITRLNPRSPYAVGKAAGFFATINYREAYNMFACSSICFNMEGPLRGENFITRKVTLGCSRIKLGLQDELVVGSLSARRDWNHIKDSIAGMRLILESDYPDDYCIGSGESYSVQELIEKVFGMLDLDWKKYVKVDLEKYGRPTEVNFLRCDPTKIKKLGWSPNYSFDDLIKEMVDSDMKLAQQEKLIKESK